MQLLMIVSRSSIYIVHLVWHMVRTPILPLSHGILSLIRRHIPCLRGEHVVSVMDSCDVDITYLNGALLQHMPLAVRFNAWPSKCDETARDSRSCIATPVLCPLMFPALL